MALSLHVAMIRCVHFLKVECGPQGCGPRGSLAHYTWAAVLQMARFGGADDHNQKLMQERVLETTLVFEAGPADVRGPGTIEEQEEVQADPEVKAAAATAKKRPRKEKTKRQKQRPRAFSDAAL